MVGREGKKRERKVGKKEKGERKKEKAQKSLQPRVAITWPESPYCPPLRVFIA